LFIIIKIPIQKLFNEELLENLHSEMKIFFDFINNYVKNIKLFLFELRKNFNLLKLNFFVTLNEF
jgi:hypothetical protein